MSSGELWGSKQILWWFGNESGWVAMIYEYKYNDDDDEINNDTDIVKWISKHVGDSRCNCVIE